MGESEGLGRVLERIEGLTADEQVALVRRLRTVLAPPAQRELSARSERGL